MLERLTAGRYVSALHRVRNVSMQDRISMPLFLDPNFDAVLAPITPLAPDAPAAGRSDLRVAGMARTSRRSAGPTANYLLNKVRKCSRN